MRIEQNSENEQKKGPTSAPTHPGKIGTPPPHPPFLSFSFFFFEILGCPYDMSFCLFTMQNNMSFLATKAGLLLKKTCRFCIMRNDHLFSDVLFTQWVHGLTQLYLIRPTKNRDSHPLIEWSRYHFGQKFISNGSIGLIWPKKLLNNFQKTKPQNGWNMGPKQLKKLAKQSAQVVFDITKLKITLIRAKTWIQKFWIHQKKKMLNSKTPENKMEKKNGWKMTIQCHMIF